MRKVASSFLLFLHVIIIARGFNLISTEFIDIAYEDGLDGHALILFMEADNIYQRISNEFGFQLTKKPIVYLLNKTDVANGYANPVNNVIVVYPNEIDPYIFTPNYENWVSFCFAHELTHLFLANAFAPALSYLSIFGHAVPAAIQSVLTPMYLHEGVAIYYETQISGAGRGKDRLFEEFLAAGKNSDVGLRYASSLNSRRWLAGGSAYVQGYSFLKYIEQKHGHEKITELIRHFTQDPLGGFYQAVKKAQLTEDLKNWLGERTPGTEGEKISPTLLSASKLDLNAWRVYYISRQYNGEEAIYYYDSFTGENIKLIEADNIITFAVSDRRQVAIARYTNNGYGAISRLYLYDDTVKDLGIDKVVDLAWKNNYEIVMIRQTNSGERFIDLYNLVEGKQRRIFGPDKGIVPLQLTASKDKIVFTAKYDGQIDLFMIHDESIVRLTNDSSVKLSPKLLSDELYFCADYAGQFSTYVLNLNLRTIKEVHVNGSISALAFQDWIYTFKVVPGGFSLFKEKSSTMAQSKVIFSEVVPLQGDITRLSYTKKHYDLMKLRFVLPFPYVSFDEKKIDVGIGAVAGLWNDLMSNYAVLGVAWSKAGLTAKGLFNSQENAFLSLQFDLKDEFLTLSTQIDIPFYLNRGLKDERIDLLSAISINQDLVLTPQVGIIYRVGSVGGRSHQVSFPDFALRCDLIPTFEIGIAKAFLVRDWVFQIFGTINSENIWYGAKTVISGPSLNIGAIDGFWAIDGINFSAGFSSMIFDIERTLDIWFKTTINAHLIYQVPVPISITVGVRKQGGYIKVTIEDIVSTFLGNWNNGNFNKWYNL